MKIKNLTIDGYKNLISTTLEHDSDIITIIGNNGSGKSNMLEALSIIFRNLYKGENRIPFDFKLVYEIFNGNLIQIEKKKSKLSYLVDEKIVISIEQFLPKKVVAIYSGDENRLWLHNYEPFYTDFINSLSKQSIVSMPKMLYLNKYYWNIALLCLCLSGSDLFNNKTNNAFVRNELGIKNIERIEFKYSKSNYNKYNSNPVVSFVSILDKKEGYTLDELSSALKILDIPQIFSNLYVASSPKTTKIIDNITLMFDDGLKLEDLSEGQKKLLLIKAALEFAGQEDTLFLLDEPDAHIHINNKEKIINIFEQYKDKRQIIITTHSPTLTQCVKNEKNLYMMSEGKFIKKRQQEIIHDMTGEFWDAQQQNIFLGSDKEIVLLVEGKHDKIHITNAYDKLKDEYPNLNFDIFSLGSESKIHPFMNGLYEANINDGKIYIAIYDNDKQGQKSFAQCEKVSTGNVEYRKLKQNTIEHNNFFAFMLPKPEGFEKDCTIENMFDSIHYETAYKEALDLSLGHFAGKSIDDIDTDIKDNSKNRLSENSKSFVKEDFKCFRKLFELVLKIKSDTQKENTTTEPTKSNEDKEKEHTPQSTTPSFKTNVYTEEDDLLSEKPQIFIDLYRRIKSHILSCDSNIKIAYRKHWIAFQRNGRDIIDIEIQKRAGLKIWFNFKVGELDDLWGVAEDVSTKGHHGNGDYEISVKDDGEIKHIFDFIQEALNTVSNRNNP